MEVQRACAGAGKTWWETLRHLLGYKFSENMSSVGAFLATALCAQDGGGEFIMFLFLFFFSF